MECLEASQIFLESVSYCSLMMGVCIVLLEQTLNPGNVMIIKGVNVSPGHFELQ